VAFEHQRAPNGIPNRTKADGTQVEVQVNSDYSVASVSSMGAGHP
jgi:hypothetical protein